MKISVVVPVMNERPTLERLVQDIIEHIAPHQYEILLIDDGSTDGSWEEIERLRASYGHIRGLRFTRNLGKTAALAAAFREADGDLVLTMDADLQDDPTEIPRFVAKLEEGYDMVCGWKAARHDPWHKTLPSHLYNAVISRVFGLDLHDTNTGYKLMRAHVAKGLRLFADMHRMVAVQAHEQGYRIAEIAVTHHPRRYGKSKYGLERIYRGLRDAFTVWLLYRCPRGPARHFGRKGTLIFGAALVILIIEIALQRALPATTLLFTAMTAAAIVIMLLGVIALGLGLFGAALLARIPGSDEG